MNVLSMLGLMEIIFLTSLLKEKKSVWMG
jgi:hypothetical protein